ncbi:uncharacterized protein LOC121202564 [Betta splendens]|uniref:Uncharacterized protein LOC121202564 n=1 Tax=Betta splendens TaxID=158456 RepID=A0A9W2Y391_BETSP|nr:uncharacterized protein LOC121202564 [Betta splendens]
MMIVVCLVLMLPVGHNQELVTAVVGVGEDVTLTCTYDITKNIETYFWIKLFGNMPVVLGKANSFDYSEDGDVSRITTKQEPGRFSLIIPKTEMSDTGFYYCLKSHNYKITFINGTFLRIKGSGPHVAVIIQDPVDPAHVGDSVTLQCSVLFDKQKQTCVEDPSVYWFRVGLDEADSSLVYAHGNSRDQCERSPDAASPQKCVYSFSRNVTRSDAGTYHCAVATCGEVLFGNGTKLDIDVVSSCDSHRDNTVLFLLCVALATSLIVIISLVCVVINTSTHCCKGKKRCS